MSETETVQEQLRQYRERVQRTLPLIANPIGWAGLVGTLERASSEIDRLARELRELATRVVEMERQLDEEHDTDDTLLAALITATLCRLPVEVVGDGDWDRYREEHGKDWMGDHRAFGGWLSGRITAALDAQKAEVARLREELERIANTNWRKWDPPMNTPLDYIAWAQSRARHTLAGGA